MSQSIDERIVAMHFENDQFEKGAKQSIKTLEELKHGLDFQGVGETFETVSDTIDKGFGLKKATRETNLFSKAIKGIGNAATFPLRALSEGFNSLNHYLNTFMGYNIASKLVNTGEQIVKTFTIDPLKTGWGEYELKMDSIKTIMTGTTAQYKKLLGADYSEEKHLQIVKDYLEELNTYADDTIYKFSDMTSNIGKFTNNGVDLEKAVASMKGIANAAAQAGQGTNEASRAMYNLSQAIGVGKLTTIDWRSIEFANMATLEFKQAFIDTAYALGKLKKEGNKYFTTTSKKLEVTAENFRETLSEGWADKDVIVAALAAYSGDFDAAMLEERFGLTHEVATQLAQTGQQAKKAATEVRTFSKMWDALKESAQSGWAISWELIFGDMSEATNLWTELNARFDKMLQEAADRRNDLLRAWRGEVTNKDAKVVSEQIKSWFQQDNWKRTYGMETMLQAEDAIDKMTKKVFEMFKEKGTGPEAVAEIVKYLNTTYNLKEEDALKIVNHLNDFYKNLGYTQKNSRNVFLDGIFEFLDSFELIKKAISDAKIAIFGEVTVETLEKITNKFKTASDSLAKWLGSFEDANSRINKIKKIFEGLFAVLKIGKVAIVEFAKRTLNTLKKLFPGFDETFKKISPTIDWLINIANQFEKDRSFKNLFDNIKKRISGRWANIKASVTKTFADMKQIFSEKGVGGVIAEIGTRFRAMLESWGIDLSPIDELRKNLSEKCSHLVTSVEEFFGLEHGTITNLWARIREVIGGIGIKKAADEEPEEQTGVEEALSFIDRVANTISNIKTSIQTFIDWVKEADWTEIGSAFYEGMMQVQTGLIGIGAGLGVFGTGKAIKSVGKRLGKISFGIGDLVDVDIGQTTLETVAETLSPTNEMLTGTAKLLLEFSASLYFMADAIDTLSKIPMPDIQKAITALGELSGLFAAFQGIMKLENYALSMQVNKNLGSGGTLFGEKLYALTKGRIGVVPGSKVSESVSYILALKEMVDDVVKLAQIEDKSHIDKAIEAIAKLSGIFAAFESLMGLARNLTGLIGSTTEKVSEVGSTSSSWFFGLFKKSGTSVSKQFSGTTLSNVTGSKISESLSFILALKGMIDAVVELSKVEDPARVDKAIGAIAKLEAIFTGFETIIMLIGRLGGLILPVTETIENTSVQGATSIITKKAGKSSNMLGSMGLLVEAEAFIVALSGMIDAVVRLASIENPDNIDKAVTAITELTALFAGFETAMKLENKLIGMIGGVGEKLQPYLGKSSGYVVGSISNEAKSYITALTGMIDGIVELAKIENPDSIDKAIDAITKLSGLFAGFEGVMKLENSLLGLIAGTPTLQFGKVSIPTGGRSTNYVAGSTLKDAYSYVIVIKEMVDDVVELAKIEKPEAIDKAIDALLKLTALFSGFETIMKLENSLLGQIGHAPTIKLGQNTSIPLGGNSTNYVAGGTLKDSLSYVIVLKEMVDSVLELSKIEDPNRVDKAIKTIESLTTIFSVFESLMKIENAFMDKFYKGESMTRHTNNFSTAANIASLAYGIKSVIDGVVALAQIDDSTKIDNGLKVVTALTGLFEVFDGLMKIEQMMMDKFYTSSSLERTTNSLSTAVNILSLTKAVQGMIDGIVELSKVGDPAVIDKAVLTITELTGLFTVFQGIMDVESNFLVGEKTFGEQMTTTLSRVTNTASLIPAVNTLVNSVTKLASADPNKIEKATECLGKIVLIFNVFNIISDLEGKLTEGSSFTGILKGGLAIVTSTIALIVGVGALVLAIGELAKLDDMEKLSSITGLLTDLTGIILGFGLAVAFISAIPGLSIGGMAKAALGIGIALVAFAASMALVGTALGGLHKGLEALGWDDALTEGLCGFVTNVGKVWTALRDAFKGNDETKEVTPLVESIEESASIASTINNDDLLKLKETISITKDITELLEKWGQGYHFEADYGNFATDIKYIATAVKDFATVATEIYNTPEIDISAVDKMMVMLNHVMLLIDLAQLYQKQNKDPYGTFDWIDFGSFIQSIGDNLAGLKDDGKVKNSLAAFTSIVDEMNAAIEEASHGINTTPFITAIVAGIKTPSNRKELALALIEMGNRLAENGMTLDLSPMFSLEGSVGQLDLFSNLLGGKSDSEILEALGWGSDRKVSIMSMFKEAVPSEVKELLSGFDAETIEGILNNPDMDFNKIDIVTMFEVGDVAPIVADLIAQIQQELDKPENSLGISFIPQWTDDISAGKDIASLIGPITIAPSDIATITTTITTSIETNTAKITSAISGLSSDISGVKDAISEMSIILDSGAIAGAVDQALGRTMGLKYRGKYTSVG